MFNGISLLRAIAAAEIHGCANRRGGLGDGFYGLGDRKNGRPNRLTPLETIKKSPREGSILLCSAKILYLETECKWAAADDFSTNSRFCRRIVFFFAVAWQRRRIGLEAAAAVEAVGAEAAFGQADGLDELLEFVEAQGGEAQAAAYLLDEALILG